MSGTVLTPKQFHMSLEGVGSYILNKGAYFEFNSVGSSGSRYAIYEHPLELPVGTRIKVTAEVYYISGDKPAILTEFFNNSQFTGSSVYSSNITSDQESDWVKLETVKTVAAGNQYFRTIIGFFLGNKNGLFRFRNVKLELDCATEYIYPTLFEQVTYSKRWAGDDLKNVSQAVASGAANIAYTSGKFVMDATTGYAEVRIGGSGTTRSIYKKNMKLIRVRCKNTLTDGAAGIRVKFLDGYTGTLIATRYIGINGGQTDGYLACPSGASVARIEIGISSTQQSTNFELYDVDVQIFGGDSGGNLEPYYCYLSKSGGNWTIDEGYNRFGSQGFTGVSATASLITVTSNSPTCRIVPICDTTGFSGGSGYLAKVKDISAGSLTIEIYNIDTGAVVDPTSVADGTAITLLAMSVI